MNHCVKIFDGGLLREIRRRPGVPHGFLDLALHIDRQADHGRPRQVLFDPPSRFNSVHSRHIDVHDDDIRMQLVRAFDGFLPIRRLPDDEEIFISSEDAFKTLANQQMIIDQ